MKTSSMTIEEIVDDMHRLSKEISKSARSLKKIDINKVQIYNLRINQYEQARGN